MTQGLDFKRVVIQLLRGAIPSGYVRVILSWSKKVLVLYYEFSSRWRFSYVGYSAIQLMALAFGKS